ncbi:hypothetical protein C8Q75DRAFT_535388 [Abortiporus biennis]|nr:hypothetical protein C8Q75DRAFT_535388 [Abortiporus biennis]
MTRSDTNPVDGDPAGLPLTFANLSLHSNSPPPSRRSSVSDILSSPEWSSVDSETRRAQDEADEQALVEDLKAIDRERRERAERQGTYPFLMPRYSSWYSVESDSDSQVSDRDVDGGEEEQNDHPIDDDATGLQRAFGDLGIHSESPLLSPQPSVHGLFSGPEFSSEDSETERARYAAEMQEVMDDIDGIVRECSERRERAERERALPSAPYDFGGRDPALRSRYLSWDCDHEPNDVEEGNYDGEGEESDVDNDPIEDDADPEVGEDAENEAKDEDHLSRPSSPEVTLEYEYDENDSDCSRISFITTRTYDMLVTMKKWGLPLPKGFK